MVLSHLSSPSTSKKLDTSPRPRRWNASISNSKGEAPSRLRSCWLRGVLVRVRQLLHHQHNGQPRWIAGTCLLSQNCDLKRTTTNNFMSSVRLSFRGVGPLCNQAAFSLHLPLHKQAVLPLHFL